MDPHGSHPSDSIHNAAYPDSSYQPSQGGGAGGGSDKPPQGVMPSPMLGISPVSSHPPLQQQHSYSPSQHSNLDNALSPHSSLSTSSHHMAPPSPWGVSGPQGGPVPMPTGPPPPYDPAQPPSSYSPLDNAPSPHAQSRPADLRILAAAPASTHYPPSVSSAQSPYPHSPNPYGGSTGTSLENAPTKLGPVAEARRRKKRKVKICVVTLCAVLLFLIALIVGVAVGVLKVQLKNGNGGPPPNHDQD
ncbi:hypothetical protein B0J13DRAFT_185808 [Dactylonectria estremocensis]|uniref:Uncharacterized protein n=1 Tax=Dactylonectria estremocensis TaxID=1079267 RepID=A0A9P9FCD3_9HYPO|nr:hypothetical protein B0J13DRAFT_185808 [Dactylonectria estremocensis]